MKILGHYRTLDGKVKIPEQDWPLFAISWSNNGGADDASVLALMTRHISAVSGKCVFIRVATCKGVHTYVP